MRKVIAIAMLALLSACAHEVKYVPGPTTINLCPAEGTANVPDPPEYPLQQSAEQSKVYAAVANAVGNDRAQTILRYWESELPSYSNLGWERVRRIVDWCNSLLPH